MDDLLVALAGNPALPAALVDRLIGLADEDLAQTLAGRSDLTVEQIRRLVGRCKGAAVMLAYDGRLSAEDLEAAFGLGEEPDSPDSTYARLALLDEGRGRPEWARRLAADPGSEIRQKLAACPALPPDVCEVLAADPDLEVVAELAAHVTDPVLLARLAGHRHADVRIMVAANRAAPPELLAALIANDPPPEVCRVCDQRPVPFVHGSDCALPDCALLPGDACDGSHESAIHRLRCLAVDNPATSTSSLAKIADRPEKELRWGLAERPDLPPEVAERLAGDSASGVRHSLAENPGLPVELMRRLADDQTHEVRRRLAYNPGLPLDVLDRLAATTRIGPALLPRIAAATAEEVRRLATSDIPEVRMLLATRRDLPADVRDGLAADPDAKVVAAVAGHPGLSGSLLAGMVAVHGVRVKSNVAANPDAPSDLLLDLAREQPRVPKALREIARHPNACAEALEHCLADETGERARPIAAAHPALSPDRVAELLADPNPQVAESAAGNPSLPRAEMIRLIEQVSARVR
ncbi:hypothetical protein [Actinoplanes regularis]|uniref:hypothetical protein n=1 Tax=Actinoplanes regularis TaxID=52697 RepID=UPI0024A3C075|nr:hypothetical protein [Actinoplanes regularis]GLW32157.1 hypothetical protein Areg01_50960 [Actinoplanes regularis]